jgi:hypothetical protein
MMFLKGNKYFRNASLDAKAVILSIEFELKLMKEQLFIMLD